VVSIAISNVQRLMCSFTGERHPAQFLSALKNRSRQTVPDSGLSEVFSRGSSIVLTSEDVGYDKPNPKFFEKGCELVHLKNSELWYVGNRYHEDVVGARNAGITPVFVERGGHRHRSRDCLAVTNLLSLPRILKDHIP